MILKYETHLDSRHDPAVQLSLVWGVVRDGPARRTRENRFLPKVKLCAAICLSKVLGDHLLQIPTAAQVCLPAMKNFTMSLSDGWFVRHNLLFDVGKSQTYV